jgi:Caspase domain
LKTTFRALNFTVKVYKDLTWKAIQKRIYRLAHRTDHANNDCLIICILSHGGVGYISAKDVDYKLESIFTSFVDEKCPSLAGKPKLFFVQACRGTELDDGIEMHTEYDSSDHQAISFPSHPDFLIAYSTIHDHFSFRNPTKGARFVQVLCEELNKSGHTDDFLSIMTTVSRLVAIDFQSNSSDAALDAKKQMPCTVSMLTRLLYFPTNNPKNIGVMCCF